MNKRIILLLFICIAKLVSAIGPYSSLNMLTFLHTDRYCYVSGDFILLNGYHFCNNSNARLNETALYIDIVNTENVFIKGDILKIKDGIATGVMQIPDSLRTGEYLLRAYTNHSKQFVGQDILYTQKIYVTNRFGNNGPLVKVDISKLTVPTDSVIKTLISKSKYVSLNISDKIFSKRSKVVGALRLEGVSSLISSLSVKPVSPYEVYYDTLNNRTNLYTGIANGTQLVERSDFAESKGIICSGQVVDKETNKPMSNMIVFVSISDSILRFRAGITDTDGNFDILLNSFYDKKEFYISCLNYPSLKHNRKAIVNLNSKFIVNKDYTSIDILGSLFEKSNDTLNVRKATINKAYKISTVNSQAYIDTNVFSYEHAYLLGDNYFSVNLDDYIDFIDFDEIVREIVPYIKVKDKDGKHSITTIDPVLKIPRSNAFVFVDGVPLDDISKIVSFKATKIKKVDVVGEPRIYGNVGFFSGIVMVWTRDLDFWDDLNADDAKVFIIKGLQSKVSVEFPNYRNENINSLPDFRQTLYWNPELNVQNQNSTTFEFYTSDEAGWFEVCIKGVSDSGRPIFIRDIIYVE